MLGLGGLRSQILLRGEPNHELAMTALAPPTESTVRGDYRATTNRALATNGHIWDSPAHKSYRLHRFLAGTVGWRYHSHYTLTQLIRRGRRAVSSFSARHDTRFRRDRLSVRVSLWNAAKRHDKRAPRGSAPHIIGGEQE